MIEVHAEFPQREVIQANAVVDNEEKTVSEVIISAKPEITGVTASIDNETGTPYVDVTETGTGIDFSFDLAFHNLKGDKGDTGETGQDGFSPSASVSQSGGVTTISITDKNGTTTESIDLSNYATQTDLTNGLATKQDTISDLSTIRSNATNGQSAYTTIGGYGDIVTYNASNFIQKNGDSSTQTISLTSGTGTTALGIKSMATSSYISFSGSSGWLGSFGVTSNKRPAFYNGTGYTLAYTSEIPTNTSDLINDSGFITGIGSNDVITALGYTPASNSAFTGADGTNAGSSGLVPAPSATDNDKYLKGDGTWASVSGGSSTDVQINGTSITSNNVANILTESAYSSSNKIATMSDIPADKIFVAEYNVTTYQQVLAAYNAGKTIVCYDNTHINSPYDVIAYLTYYNDSADIFYFTCGIDYLDNTYNAYILDTSSWTNTGGTIPSTSDFEVSSNKVTSISSSSTNTQYPSAKLLYDQLALKQNTSTAVTHTASTAVGSSTTPVYIASNGTATSTGLSIASSRFDGQWVLFSDPISLSTATSATTTDVTSTIKSNMGASGTDSYKYEVLIQAYCNYKSATSALCAITTNQTTYLITVTSGTTTSRFFGIIPVYSDKVLKFQRTAAMDACTIYFCGYRRIGTNS